jgi:hypothetical protein
MRIFLVLLALSVPAFGAAKKPVKKTPPPATVTKTILQMEFDWVRAAATKDRATIDRILADDWTSTDFHGKTVTKPQAVSELESAAANAPAIELGEMKVRVLGTTVIVTGKDRSGKYAWLDVFLKRNGHWQAVASQSTRVE